MASFNDKARQKFLDDSASYRKEQADKGVTEDPILSNAPGGSGVYRFGGGGSGSSGGGGSSGGSSGGGETAAQAQARINAENVARIKAQQLAVEQAAIDKRNEQIRQNKIKSGTISGQLSGGKTNNQNVTLPASNNINQFSSGTQIRNDFGSMNIDLNKKTNITPQTSYGAYDPIQASQKIGTGTTGSPRYTKDLFVSAGKQFFFEGGTPISALGTLASPLQKYAPKKGGDIEFQFGSTYGSQPSSKYGDGASLFPTGAGQTQTKTSFEIQREQALADSSLLLSPEAKAQKISGEISSQITPGLQSKINTGEITVKEAEEKYKILFEEEAKKPKYQADIQRNIAFQRGVESGYKPAFDVVGASELTGTLAASTNPLGSAIVGASFVYEGLPKVTGGKTKKERALGVLEVGSGLAFGGLGVIQAEKIADRALVNELLTSKRTVTGQEILKSEEGSLFKIKSKKSFGKEASVESDLLVPTFKTGEDTFSITGGRGTSKLSYFSVEKGKRITTTEDIIFGGRGAVSKEIPLVSKGGLKVGVEDSFGSFGTGFVKKKGQDTFKIIKFGGATKDVETTLGSFSLVKSGTLRSVRLGKVKNLFKGGKLFGNVKGRYSIQEEGLIKKLPKLTEESADKGYKILSPNPNAKRTSFSSTFGTTVQEAKVNVVTAPPSGITSSIEKQVFKPTKLITNVETRTSTTLINEPKIKELPPQTQTGVISNVFVEGKPKIKTGIKTGVASKGAFAFKPPIPKYDILVGTAILQKPKSELRQKLVPRTVIPKTPFGFDPYFNQPFKGGSFFGFPKFSLPSFAKSKRKSQRGKQRTQYQPSFTASALNIKAIKAPSIVGVSVRPIIQSRRKRL